MRLDDVTVCDNDTEIHHLDGAANHPSGWGRSQTAASSTYLLIYTWRQPLTEDDRAVINLKWSLSQS